MTSRRTVGVNGTRISAVRGTNVLGYIEVDTNLDSANRMSRLSGWADVGNLYVDESCRRQGVGTWLVGQAAEWLDLGGVARLLDYADADDDRYQGYEAFLKKIGFRVLMRTLRGLLRR